MGLKSRQVTEFPLAFDESTTPYGLNQFTPSARSLSDLNSNFERSSTTSFSGSKVSVRMAKAVFVGDVGVGKTSILNRFCRDIFENEYKTTIGVDFEMERFWILNVPFNVQIWDTAGELKQQSFYPLDYAHFLMYKLSLNVQKERFKCIAASYYRGSNVIVTVFDASNLESLSTCQRWMDDAVGANLVEPIKFLVATKMDLVPEGHRDKIHQIGLRMANLLQAEYWPISSKSGENIEWFFRRMAVLGFEIGLANEVKEGLPNRNTRLQRESSIVHPSSRDNPNVGRRISRCSSCKNL